MLLPFEKIKNETFILNEIIVTKIGLSLYTFEMLEINSCGQKLTEVTFLIRKC